MTLSATYSVDVANVGTLKSRPATSDTGQAIGTYNGKPYWYYLGDADPDTLPRYWYLFNTTAGNNWQIADGMPGSGGFDQYWIHGGGGSTPDGPTEFQSPGKLWAGTYLITQLTAEEPGTPTPPEVVPPVTPSSGLIGEFPNGRHTLTTAAGSVTLPRYKFGNTEQLTGKMSTFYAMSGRRRTFIRPAAAHRFELTWEVSTGRAEAVLQLLAGCDDGKITIDNVHYLWENNPLEIVEIGRGRSSFTLVIRGR